MLVATRVWGKAEKYGEGGGNWKKAVIEVESSFQLQCWLMQLKAFAESLL